MIQRSTIAAALVVAATGLATLAPAASADVSGSIDRAIATPDWLFGSFAASISYGDCSQRVGCRWKGWLIVQPASSSCDGQDGPPSPGDRGIVAATGDQTTDGAVSLSQESWPILPGGVPGQRLCLYLLDQGTVPNPVCATDPACDPPTLDLRLFAKLAERDFGVEAQPAPAPRPAPAPPAPVHQVQLSLSEKVAMSKAKAALRRKFGLKYKRARSKRLTCRSRSSAIWRCAYSFRYRKAKWNGTVTVVRTTEGIATTVKFRKLE